jgi:glycosyltransferase involved in cell wall biosynthesis
MLVYNNCVRDPRVDKEARSLARRGYEVTVIALEDATTPAQERRDGFEIERVLRNPPHYRILRGGRRARRKARRTRGRVLRVGRRLRSVGGRLVSGRPAAASAAVFAPSRPSAAAAPLAPQAGTTASGVAYRALMVLHKPLLYADFYMRAFRLARHGRYDIVHAHDLNTMPAAWAIARRTGARLVFDAHELYAEVSTLSHRERRVWRVIERTLIGRADAVITVCTSIADELVRRYAVAPPAIVLNCPVAEDAQSAPGALATAAGLEQHVPIVLYQGGFSAHRGLPDLVRAAADVPGATFVLMGWGTMEPVLRELIEELGIGDRVRIVAPVPPSELLKHTAGATVGVIPYVPHGLNNRYTTPNKLFEYINAGVPVLGSHLPELERFILGYDVGRTFRPGDAADLAAQLNLMLGDQPALERQRQAASRARAELTWESQEKTLFAVYDRLGLVAPEAPVTVAA